MTLVLSKAVFVQLCRIRGTNRTRVALKVSLIGRRAGKRVVIESARRSEAVTPRSFRKVVGEVFFDQDGQYLLTPSEKQHISDMLREKNEVAVVVTVFSRNGDLAFYPVYFSQDIPNGVDMALEYEGSTVCQSRSALGGSCGAPWKETKIRTDHRQVPVYIQGRWISVDRKLARLVRLVNQIPGIASLRSCQGGMPDAGKSRHDSPAQDPPTGVHDQTSVVSKRNPFNTDDPLCYVRVVMEGKKRGRIFWLALVGYAAWLTIVLRHAISNNKPVGSLLVLSIVPPLVVVLLWRQGEKWRAKKP